MQEEMVVTMIQIFQVPQEAVEVVEQLPLVQLVQNQEVPQQVVLEHQIQLTHVELLFQ
tara:strand:+ start:206 stop:379 length:174 start_codon:yes stop_codon:yes gene_type:complete